MSRFYTHQKGLYFKYRLSSDIWRNKYFEDRLWQIKEEWFVGIRFVKKWFDKWSVYYDGHTVDSITICGVELIKGYTYESQSLADWVQEDYECKNK